MKVSELGEFGLINLLAEMAYSTQDNQKTSGQQLIIGIGDDTAAWRNDNSIQLATIDSLIQDIHFSFDINSWEELGWKSMAANISDIAAMGGIPKYALVSLAMPVHTSVKDITDFYKGMINLAKQFSVALIGGDTNSSPIIAISITIFGSSGQNQSILTRSAARPGDKIAVTGKLGGAAAGERMLRQKLQFNLEASNCLKKAFLHPSPRVNEGRILAKNGIKSAIDISDGLIQDLGHICKASQVSAKINIDSIPILPAVKASFSNIALELALSGGEDYELLFTGNNQSISRIKKLTPLPITIIGEITDDKTGEITLADKNGKPFNLTKTGWDHFTAN
ncbi:MAG: thiamine-phosphate kinase [Dehalococcoidales bacterium]|nr:thiamine-phosphate kinase [Dehalococcoidales bacterium]